MDYYNRVQGFINFATSIPRNFTRGGIRCPCRKCQNKKNQCPIVEEEPNADAARFFDLLKDSDEPLWDEFNHYD